MARLLIIAMLLGNTLAVWASVDAYFASQDMANTACHMHDDNHSHENGSANCCGESQDCISHCAMCLCSIVSNLFNYHDNLLPGFVPEDKPIAGIFTSPEGITTGLLYRPPIFSA